MVLSDFEDQTAIVRMRTHLVIFRMSASRATKVLVIHNIGTEACQFRCACHAVHYMFRIIPTWHTRSRILIIIR